jgi:hypothetical protein
MPTKEVTTASWTPTVTTNGIGSGSNTAQTSAADLAGHTASSSNLPAYLTVNFVIKD